MSDPAQLEHQAEQLRAFARTARTKATALATQLDALVTGSADRTLWEGPYPTAATTSFTGQQGTLKHEADVLEQDATAWETRAGHLEDDAADGRAELKKQQQAKDDAAKTPTGAR